MPRLTAALAANNAAVLVAPPGAGKTTRVPLVLLDEPWAKDKKILVLEPRRLAARAAAARMASTLGEQVGDTVGLRVRFGSKISKRTRIEVITEGVFTRLILDDPSLDGVAAVLFDEFHERSFDADLGLALARDVQQALRDDLKILVMSATLDGARVAALLGGAPVVESEGRSFAGRDALSRPRCARAHRSAKWPMPCNARLRADSGSVLVFLPGAAEIRRTETLLKERVADPNVDIVALFGALDAREQDRAISPAPAGRRKVVLATSIAETSLTIEGVRVVIDCGLVAGAALRAGCRADAAGNGARLARGRRPAPRPRRAHRAGRLLPAVGRAADRLAWSPIRGRKSSPPTCRRFCSIWRNGAPAIRPSWRFSIRRRWPRSARRKALLSELGAIDAQGRITDEGRRLRALPLPPRLARMVVDAAAEGAGG